VGPGVTAGGRGVAGGGAGGTAISVGGCEGAPGDSGGGEAVSGGPVGSAGGPTETGPGAGVGAGGGRYPGSGGWDWPGETGAAGPPSGRERFGTVAADGGPGRNDVCPIRYPQTMATTNAIAVPSAMTAGETRTPFMPASVPSRRHSIHQGGPASFLRFFAAAPPRLLQAASGWDPYASASRSAR